MEAFILIAWAFFVAFGFSWGIICTYSGAGSAWIGSMIMFGGGIIVPLINAKQLTTQAVPEPRAFITVLAFSVFNALAVIVFADKLNYLKTIDAVMPAWAFVAIVNISMYLIAFMIEVVFNGKSFSASQIAGLCTAGLTIYLFSR
jgi:hypothetical protein